jgi:hypothetical protein
VDPVKEKGSAMIATLQRTVAAFVMLAATCVAQHWQGTVNFPTTPNGPLTYDVTINNADTADSGVGTVDKTNGETTNIPFTWTRDENDKIVIEIDDEPAAELDDVPKGQPKDSTGDAALNDGSPPSAGTYTRGNIPAES